MAVSKRIRVSRTRGASVQHFLMHQFLRQNAGGHIRDAGNRQHFHPHVIGDDGFGHRGHADQIRRR